MKMLVLAMLFAIVQATTPLPRETANNSTGYRTANQPSANAEKGQTSRTGPSAGKTNDTPEKKPDTNPTSSNTQQPISVRELPTVTVYTDWWFRFYVIFTGSLVLVGILGVVYAVRTLQAIERQADTTEKTVNLMRDTNTQWVELEPYGLFTETEVGQPDPPTIVIIHPRWKIINKSSLPLTLKTVEVKIGRDEGWKTYVFEFDELISPAGYRTFFAPLPLNTAETSKFLGNYIELSIAIKSDFVGVSGRLTEQFFGDMYVCKVGSLEISHPLGKGPQRQYMEQYEGPSTLVEERGFRVVEDDLDQTKNPN